MAVDWLGFLGLDKKAFDEPGEIAASLLIPTYTTGRIVNSALGKSADEQSFKDNLISGAGAEALAGAAYFGGAYAAGAGPFASGGAGGSTGSLLGGTQGAVGPGAVSAPNLGAAYVPGAPQAGPFALAPTEPYYPGAPGPGPYALPGDVAPTPATAEPNMLQRFGKASDAYSQAQQNAGGIPQPRPNPPLAPIAEPPPFGGPITLTPALAQALAGRTGPGPLLPSISGRLLFGPQPR